MSRLSGPVESADVLATSSFREADGIRRELGCVEVRATGSLDVGKPSASLLPTRVPCNLRRESEQPNSRLRTPTEGNVPRFPIIRLVGQTMLGGMTAAAVQKPCIFAQPTCAAPMVCSILVPVSADELFQFARSYP